MGRSRENRIATVPQHDVVVIWNDGLQYGLPETTYTGPHRFVIRIHHGALTPANT